MLQLPTWPKFSKFQCRRRGRPCESFEYCKRRVTQGSKYCSLCTKRGPFCIGPDGSGCQNFNTGKPRRACYDNAGRCAYCRRYSCSVPRCHRQAVRSSGTRFCARHRPNQHILPPHSATIATRAPSVSPSHLENTCKSRSSRRCAVNWCTAPARKRTFPSEAAPVYVCNKHARWFGSKNPRTGRGFRSGYLAAAETIDAYVCGRVQVARLSETGAFTETCIFCGALYFKVESVRVPSISGRRRAFTRCCQRGALACLPLLPEPPHLLTCLLTGKRPDTASIERGCLGGNLKSWCQLSRHFQDNIRAYNGALSFAAYTDANTSTTADQPLPASSSISAPPVYVLHGRVYHVVGTLYAPHDSAPKCSQLYVFDPVEATARRSASFPQLHKPLLQILLNMLTELVPSVLDPLQPSSEIHLHPRNPYPSFFRSMHETITAAHECKSPDRADAAIHTLRFCGGSDKDPRTYSLPSSAEVACCVVGEGPLPKHFISVYERSDDGSVGTTHQLSYLSEHVDPLAYPLVHVDGTLGYSTALHVPIPSTTGEVLFGRKISMAQFYAYRVMQRTGADSGVVELPHCAGRLFQQYIVDAYAKVESMRLDWIQRNQSALRLESLQGLMDHIAGANNLDIQFQSGSFGTAPSRCASVTASGVTTPPQPVGTPVILPCTFGGSPRSLHQNYLDSMALIARFGKPDLFITATANPGWLEIQQNLRPGETAANRPELVARVFRAKLRRLLELLTKEHAFGRCVAYTYVIEFQKRGLPHAHILLILVEADKPTTPSQIDRLISAEIPDPDSNSLLYDLVNRHMVHGPCGALNPDCPCMQDGLCTKFYPKDWREETVVNLNGYPAYRRRRSAPLRTVAKGLLDTRSVVPHSPFLLDFWEGHLNVEVCTSIKAVKYLYKYTYKGPDRACLEHTHNEISDFLDSRYVGAPEAAWRLLEYELHGRQVQVMEVVRRVFCT